MKKKVLVTCEVFEQTLEHLAQHFEVISNQANAKLSADELGQKLQGVHGAVISTVDRIDDALLARCPGLTAICSVSVGYNHIDVDACTKHGVMVTNTPGVLTQSVADFAVCLTLATCRRLTEAVAFLRSGEWKGTHLKEMLGQDRASRDDRNMRVWPHWPGHSAASAGVSAQTLVHRQQSRFGGRRARTQRYVCRQGRAVASVGHCDSDSALHARNAPLHWRGRTWFDEALPRSWSMWHVGASSMMHL